MLVLAFRNLWRRPLRSVLTLSGVAAASIVLVCVVAFGDGYRAALNAELERSGVQMMLVPLGCPYDSASRVLKNNTLEHSLPVSAWQRATQDPAVAVAAPLLIASQPRHDGSRADLWIGLDESALKLKPWWQVRSGRSWFGQSNEVVLGADVAAIEMRLPDEKFFSPEAGREFRVAGILNRSGTSDDTGIFLPLEVAQQMFSQTGRLTAVAIRLHDPALVRETALRLQKIPGAQVVTMTEMMGTFLNLIGAVRTLMLSIAAIAVAISALTVFNTLLAAVVERTRELALMRAVGASRTQIFLLLVGEALMLSLGGAVVGGLLALAVGPYIEGLARNAIPFSPSGTLLAISTRALLMSPVVAFVVGGMASIYPAWKAATLPPALGAKIE